MNNCKKCGRPVQAKAFLCDACKVRLKEGAVRVAKVAGTLAVTAILTVVTKGKYKPKTPAA